MAAFILPKPTVVVDLGEKLVISEVTGGASSGRPQLSIANVTSSGGFTEDWQTPAFDEWLMVTEGSITIKTTHAPDLVVSGGQTVFINKGNRVSIGFNEGGAKYTAICLPAFSPANVHREEGTADDPSKASPPSHDAHFDIYHLVQNSVWDEAKESKKVYFPPTYAADGFTHATADPKFLIGVANHFYKDVVGGWSCLRMNRKSLSNAGIDLKWEDPSPVGTTPALNGDQSGGQRFPHIYGGIPSDGNVVLQEYPVVRAEDGTFLSIEGLC